MAGDAEACELAVYFDTDSTRLDQGSQQRLDRVADCMKRHDVDHAVVVGRADPRGPEKYNEALGMKRAEAVAKYLLELGVPEKDILVRSQGETAAADRQIWPAERRAAVSVQ